MSLTGPGDATDLTILESGRHFQITSNQKGLIRIRHKS